MTKAPMSLRKLLILGAGFGVPAGLPTMRCFFPTVWNLMGYATGLGGHKRDIPAFQALLPVWKDWCCKPETKNPLDLEEFSLFVDKCRRDLVPDLRYVIARTFDLSKDKMVGYQDTPVWKTIYLAFAKQVLQCQRQITVLSLNYSLLLDQSLLQVGAKPLYYLPKIVPLNDDRKCREPVNVLKPHGSINWLVPKKDRGDDVVVDYHAGPADGRCAGNWQTSEEICHPKDNSRQLMPFVVPPRETGKRCFNAEEDQALRHVRNYLKDLLSEVEMCFIIGWSAPETDKNDIIPILRDGLKRCKSVYVLNYSDGHDGVPDTLKEKYNDLFPKVKLEYDWNGMRKPDSIPLLDNFLRP